MTGLLAISGPGHVWALILVPFAGIYATCNVGMSGGPNHGEHPFIINVIHLIAFCIKAQHWPRPLFWAYFGVLFAATALAAAVQELRGGWTDRPVLLPRLGMAALYMGLTWMVVFGVR
jgi:hypothetical protein